MTLARFIKKNRGDLVAHIKNSVGKSFKVDNDEIEIWISNDEALYNWAKSEGVRFDE